MSDFATINDMKKAKEKIRRNKVSKSLEKAINVAKVQVLHEGGSSYRDIALMLRMSSATVSKYLKITDEEVKAVKTTIRKKQMFEDYHVADKARQRIEATLDKASFRDTVGAWKIARELQMPRYGTGSGGTAIQININGQKGNVSIEDTSTVTTNE